MAAALVPPTKSAHPIYEICPSNLRNMPIRPTKNIGRKMAHTFCKKLISS